ncbi:MAG: hypothetical protein ABSE79_07745 [Terriglobia bacterium]|jgi:hypothetical protein
MSYLYVNPYKAGYLAALNELARRREELEFVKARISQLEETIRTLEPLANEEGVAPAAGLSEICRQILMSQPGAGFTANQVMQQLSQGGVDISGYSQPLAVLHTTLGRLCKPGSGFVKGINTEGQPVFVYGESERTMPRFPRFGVGR